MSAVSPTERRSREPERRIRCATRRHDDNNDNERVAFLVLCFWAHKTRVFEDLTQETQETQNKPPMNKPLHLGEVFLFLQNAVLVASCFLLVGADNNFYLL